MRGREAGRERKKERPREREGVRQGFLDAQWPFTEVLLELSTSKMAEASEQP